MGKNLAFTSVHFTDAKNIEVARGSHTKFIGSALKDPRNEIDTTERVQTPTATGDSTEEDAQKRSPDDSSEAELHFHKDESIENAEKSREP